MGGNHEGDGGMTEKEEEKRRSSERSQASTCVDQADESAPVFISITLTAQTYSTLHLQERNRECASSPKICNSLPRDAKSLIMA